MENGVNFQFAVFFPHFIHPFNGFPLLSLAGEAQTSMHPAWAHLDAPVNPNCVFLECRRKPA